MKGESRGIYITGTDTGVGKTVVTGLLADYLLRRGISVVTQKWVQSGCTGFPEDIAVHLRLMDRPIAGVQPFLSLICPYVLSLPASAHLAAEMENQVIDAQRIEHCYHVLAERFDMVLVEGMGGTLVPYSRRQLLIDIAVQLDLPVLIVAGNKLGAINHTLLTVEALQSRGMTILGVVFNRVEEVDEEIALDNPRIVEDLTGRPIFGTLPWVQDDKQLKILFESTGQAIEQALTKL